MKKLLLLLLSVTFLFSCTEIRKFIEPNTELYEITDGFVESLQSTYQSYGLLGGYEYTKYTKDGLYKVMPTGRLINVRIEKSSTSEEYNKLMEDLKDHYKDNKKVNDVYICRAGTIMIDCRK